MAEDNEKGGLAGLLDSYSRNARLYPAILILAPLLMLPIVLASSEKLAGFAIIGLIAAAVLFPLMGWIRERGTKLQPTLYAEWGAVPTTRMLHWEDRTIDETTKTRYYKFFEDNKVVIPTPEQQKKEQAESNNKLASAVKYLIENRRGNSLVVAENASYGFRRNLYAVRWVGVIIAGLAAIVNAWPLFELLGSASVSSFADFQQQVEMDSLFGLAVDLLLLLFFITRSKPWIKNAADTYALALLKTCDKA
jgi:hypothetical protein